MRRRLCCSTTHKKYQNDSAPLAAAAALYATNAHVNIHMWWQTCVYHVPLCSHYIKKCNPSLSVYEIYTRKNYYWGHFTI